MNFLYSAYVSFIVTIVCLLTSYNTKSDLHQPTQLFGQHIWHQAYQDQIINNSIVAHGKVTQLEDRYKIIKKIAEKYERPFTVIDIGAAQGYYAFRLAHDFPHATVVMVEEDEYLSTLCKKNDTLSNIIFLQKRISIQELLMLGQCEHFDIVLGLNIIHWFESKWQEVTDALLALGDRIIIETPPTGDTLAIGAPYLSLIETYLRDHGAKVIGSFARHTRPDLFSHFYIVTQKKTDLPDIAWALPTTEGSTQQIKSTLTAKTIKRTILINGKKKQYELEVPAGIHLTTFIALNGVFPEWDTLQTSLTSLIIKNELTPAPAYAHLIVQGSTIIGLHVPPDTPFVQQALVTQQIRDDLQTFMR